MQKKIQFLEFMGESNLTHVHSNYLICMLCYLNKYGIHSSSLWLAFHASVQQGKTLKMRQHCAQQPDYTAPCLPKMHKKPLS